MQQVRERFQPENLGSTARQSSGLERPMVWLSKTLLHVFITYPIAGKRCTIYSTDTIAQGCPRLCGLSWQTALPLLIHPHIFTPAVLTLLDNHCVPTPRLLLAVAGYKGWWSLGKQVIARPGWAFQKHLSFHRNTKLSWLRKDQSAALGDRGWG